MSEFLSLSHLKTAFSSVQYIYIGSNHYIYPNICLLYSVHSIYFFIFLYCLLHIEESFPCTMYIHSCKRTKQILLSHTYYYNIYMYIVCINNKKSVRVRMKTSCLFVHPSFASCISTTDYPEHR